MKLKIAFSSCICLVWLFAGLVSAQEKVTLQSLEQLFDSTRAVEAHVFAPKTFENVDKKYNESREAISRGKKQKDINKVAGEFRSYAENAIKSTEVTRIAMEAYLEPRDKAKAAEAPRLAPELYSKAEEQFIKATGKVEGGNSKSGLKEAEKALPMFDAAELAAIKIQIMGEADRLIAQAESDEAAKFAPSTLDKARSARTKCDAILSQDRYEREASVNNARLAEYEARHASSIAQSVRSMERNDQAWERLMLLYEIEMQKIGNQLDITQVPFDTGPIGAAEAMIKNIKSLQSRIAELENINSDVSTDLKVVLDRLGVSHDVDSPLELAQKVDKIVEKMAIKLDSSAARLADLEYTQEKLAKELGERQEKEQKIENARSILNPTEGEVLLNATDDIVVRLYGLSFASGSSDITDGHVGLLKKVREILETFPDSKLLVEGHTDDRGERTTNMRLSERRAFSVMQYLRKLMSIPAERVDAVGYGPDKPIGTNTTKDGRAKNRRIDILIFQ